MRGRSIQTHIHIARSVLETVSDETGQVALFQTELAKVLRKVRREFLFAVLEHANIGHFLLSGVRLCYKEPYTRLIVNQHITKPVPLKS